MFFTTTTCTNWRLAQVQIKFDDLKLKTHPWFRSKAGFLEIPLNSMWLPILWWLGLNPGLFIPVLLLAVVMMEKAGKTCHLQWHTFVGCVEEWHIPGKITIKWVCYRSQTRTMEGLSTWHQAVLAMFLGFRKQKELEGDQESEWWTGTGEMQESPLLEGMSNYGLSIIIFREPQY